MASCRITEGCTLIALKSLENIAKKPAPDGKLNCIRCGGRLTTMEKLNATILNGLCKICFEQGISQPKDDGLGVGGLMGQLGSMSLTNEQRKPIAQTDHVPSRGRGNMRGRGA